jgi:hypothetical protein
LFSSAVVAEPAAGARAPVPTEHEDLFAFVAPELIRRLQRPMKVKEFAASSGLVQSQADAWLKRLLAEGHVMKTKSTYRAVKRSSDNPTLF